MTKTSFEGWFTPMAPVGIFVSVSSEAMSAMPTEGSSPATLMFLPVRVRLAPGVALKSVAPVAASRLVER